MSVESAPARVAVYIGLGSNIAPEANIAAALERIDTALGIADLSPFYRSAAIGRPEQPDYLNGVVRVYTTLSARSLKFDVLRGIEADLGRGRDSDPYAARTIDLDVLLYGDCVIEEPGLVVPDPDLYTRPFLAAGVLAIAPGLRPPGDGTELGAPDIPEEVEFSQAMKARYVS